MLNMQQTVLNEVTDGDQPQEEIQLTELLPVKQSRIRENACKDVDATDALKALRSFTGGNEDFEMQAFEFCDKIVRPPKRNGKRKRRGRRRKATSKTANGNMDEKEEKEEDLQDFDNDEVVAKKIKLSEKGNDIIIPEKIIEPVVENTDFVKDKCQVPGTTSEEEVSEDEEEPLYLDLDKKDCFSDEVYVYRRESVDPCSPSGTNEEDIDVNKNREFYENDYSTTDGALFDRTTRIEETTEIVEKPADREEERNSGSDTDTAEGTEFRQKIGEIIEANCLKNNNLENNNVENAEPANPEKDTSDVPQAPSSVATQTVIDNPTTKLSIYSIQIPKQQRKTFPCMVCESVFKGPGGLRNHYKVAHGAGPLFKCNDCGKEFPLKERLKLHVRTHTGYKPYKCTECDKRFARGGQLVQHRRTHSTVKPYCCELCEGTFSCAANLALHLKRHNGQKDHKCDICGRGFVRRDALKKHLECLHQDVRSFVCGICKKTFKGHLPQHMRTHARDRPHGCATCGQRFAQKSQLTVHQRTHSGQRPFRCLVCWQAFAHSTALKLHTRRHTGERPFKCVECNAGFTQLPHWKKHMKCIHGRDDPYSCSKCKTFFRIKSDLDSHEKTCHQEKEADADGASNSAGGNDGNVAKYKTMNVEKMRLLLAVLLKRISKQDRLDDLGFGKRLIDEVLHDSLIYAGKEPVSGDGLSELEALTKNLEIFLEWTIPKKHWENFRKLKKTPEEILEKLTETKLS